MIGWASEGGATTGGGDATPVVVTTADELEAAIEGSAARVIHVKGSLTTSDRFVIGSNKTIVGICGAELRGAIAISGQQNVILRNLKIVGKNCADSPNECGAGDDAIGVTGSHHLWFDHLDVSDGSDGNLDMTNASDYITISWTKFWYSTERTDPEQGASGHRFANLIAGSDTDAGEYRITFHHNWWADNVNQRMPRTRYGDIHVFNNLYTASGNSYCVNAGYEARLLVENNVFVGVNDPHLVSTGGALLARGNAYEDTSGQRQATGAAFTPPYTHSVDPTAGLEDLIRTGVGPQ
jgi:pectate lyase